MTILGGDKFHLFLSYVQIFFLTGFISLSLFGSENLISSTEKDKKKGFRQFWEF